MALVKAMKKLAPPIANESSFQR